MKVEPQPGQRGKLPKFCCLSARDCIFVKSISTPTVFYHSFAVPCQNRLGNTINGIELSSPNCRAAKRELNLLFPISTRLLPQRKRSYDQKWTKEMTCVSVEKTAEKQRHQLQLRKVGVFYCPLNNILMIAESNYRCSNENQAIMVCFQPNCQYPALMCGSVSCQC